MSAISQEVIRPKIKIFSPSFSIDIKFVGGTKFVYGEKGIYLTPLIVNKFSFDPPVDIPLTPEVPRYTIVDLHIKEKDRKVKYWSNIIKQDIKTSSQYTKRAWFNCRIYRKWWSKIWRQITKSTNKYR